MIPDYVMEKTAEVVALGYDGKTAPKLKAKGSDEIAAAIVELAIANQVPIYENPELVRWLGQMELGDEIPEQLYQVIAEVLAFVFQLEGRGPNEYKSSKK